MSPEAATTPQSALTPESALRRRRRPATVAAATLGCAGAVLLATTGSPAWGILRAVVALMLAAVVVWAQRLTARPAGWAAVGLGILALPAAGVVAADHLSVGVTIGTVAAVVAALAAAVLLAAGAAGLVRAGHGWWRLLALPVAVVLLQFVVVPVGMGVLVTNRAPVDLGSATPADRGLEYQDVTLETDDGVRLAAWYVPSGNGAAVLLLHGSGSTRAATLDHAEVLAGLGYGVLMLDARGHGESGGTGMALGWHGNADIEPAVDWLASQPDVENGRIGAVGLSMGGEEALTAAAADPRILAVVAEGVGVRIADDVAPGAAGGWLPRMVNALITDLTDLFTAASPPVPLPDAVADIEPPRQVMIIAGRGEQDQARWLQEASHGNVTVWELPDTAHTAGLTTHPQEWEQRVGELLAHALGGADVVGA